MGSVGIVVEPILQQYIRPSGLPENWEYGASMDDTISDDAGIYAYVTILNIYKTHKIVWKRYADDLNRISLWSIVDGAWHMDIFTETYTAPEITALLLMKRADHE